MCLDDLTFAFLGFDGPSVINLMISFSV
jgi:hypothetical protein